MTALAIASLAAIAASAGATAAHAASAVAFIATSSTRTAAPSANIANVANIAPSMSPAGQALRTVPSVAVNDATAERGAVRFAPRDATTGYFLGGPVIVVVQNNVADIQVGQIINETTTDSAGALTVDLVETAAVPQMGANFQGFVSASFSIGNLAKDSQQVNVDSHDIPFSSPAAGCYYVSVVLLQGSNVLDIRTLPGGGTPEVTGYSEFGFGQSCPAATSCTRTANDVCLDQSRFQVTAVYNNTTTGSGAGQILQFGATRAESDESGFFYFTDPNNFELGVKVLDACAISDFFWVFIGGLTNQGWAVNVLDTQTGHNQFYANNNGVTTVTVTDTAALTCP